MKRQVQHTNILAHGEATGHANRAQGVSEVEVYEDGTLAFDASVGVVVTHEEHGGIVLPAIRMRSGRVQEYDSFLEESREIRD